MPRTGIRPHTWKIQGDIPHKQYTAWLRSKAQANFRKEIWLLSFEEYQRLWQGVWEFRGRGREDYVMSREDHNGAWVVGNVVVSRRYEYLRRQADYKRG